MNFDFSDDQKMLRDQAQRFLAEQCPRTRVREVLEGDEAHADEVWKGLVELGYTAATIPEDYGGLGLGYLELCMIAEAMGAALAPVPFSSSVYLATEALLLAGSDAQKETYLPKLAAGEITGTLAVAEGTGPLLPKSISTALSDSKLTGEKTVLDYLLKPILKARREALRER